MISRDQERAKHAYKSVNEVPKNAQKDYKILVNGFGPHIVRSGLAATLAFIERDKSEKAVQLFLEHLATAKIPGIPNDPARLFETIREAPMEDYMLITREMLKTILWFKRAVQSLIHE